MFVGHRDASNPKVARLMSLYIITHVYCKPTHTYRHSIGSDDLENY